MKTSAGFESKAMMLARMYEESGLQRTQLTTIYFIHAAPVNFCTLLKLFMHIFLDLVEARLQKIIGEYITEWIDRGETKDMI
jgi:hypothetical protein